MFQGPFLCSDEGDVFYSPALYARSTDAVVRVSGDGKKVTRFTLKSVPGFGHQEEAGIFNTAVGPDGDLYVLAGSTETGVMVVTFDKNARFKSKTSIGDRRISQIAVFKSGELLMSGAVDEQPWVGIVSTSGQEVEVHVERDPAAAKKRTLEARRGLLDLTVTASGKDGKVYVARPTPKGPVFAVSPTGEVTERFELVPPVPDATIKTIRVSETRLAVEHVQLGSATGLSSTPRWVSVYDLLNGERLAIYPSVPGSLLCYESGGGVPDSFVFLGRGAGQVQLVRASGSH